MKNEARWISVRKILLLIWNDRKVMALYILVGVIIGVIVALSIPRIYKTTVILAPEGENTGFSGSISSIAEMVGMNLNIGQSGDAIYPELYPDVMNSSDFIVSLFSVQVTTRDGKVTTGYANYLKTMQKYPWWTYPKRKIDEFIIQMKDGVKDDNAVKNVNPYRLTRREWALANSIRDNIECSVDKKTSVITISVSDQDPFVSACMADTIQAGLQFLITEYRTKKSRNDVKYLEGILSDEASQYEAARNAYADYVLGHSSTVRETVRQEADKLKSDRDLRESIYNTVAKQLQLAKAKVQEKTPVFTTLQSASIPVKPSGMPKRVIVAVFVFLAFAVRCVILLWKDCHA